MCDELNDRLDDIFGAPTVAPREPVAIRAPANYVANQSFIEGCPACRGTGSWRPGYPCFKCKGKGKVSFKTSPEERSKQRASSAQKKVRNAEEDRQAFKAAHPAEYAWLVANVDRNTFATNLFNAIGAYGDLTEKQLAAVTKIVNENANRAAAQAEREVNAPVVNASKLEEAFATARRNAARPGMQGIMIKPIKLLANDIAVKVTPGSEGSQWAGMLFIKTEDGKKLGHVKGGKFVRNYICEDVEATAVVDAINDPQKAAVAYGKAYSRCCICGRGLLNDESIARSMGPICAERFGW